jgi:hypothetical protein
MRKGKIYFSLSGEAKDSAIFAFYFLLHKRAKPATPPLTIPPPIHLQRRQTNTQ